MLHRVVGVTILGLSIYALYLATYGLRADLDFAELIATGAGMHGLSVDPADFLARWRIASFVLAFVSVLGIVAGTAMFLLQPWSWLIVLAVALSSILFSVAGLLSGYSKYEFEALQVSELLALVALAIVSIYVYRSWSRAKAAHASDA